MRAEFAAAFSLLDERINPGRDLLAIAEVIWTALWSSRSIAISTPFSGQTAKSEARLAGQGIPTTYPVLEFWQL